MSYHQISNGSEAVADQLLWGGDGDIRSRLERTGPVKQQRRNTHPSRHVKKHAYDHVSKRKHKEKGRSESANRADLDERQKEINKKTVSRKLAADALDDQEAKESSYFRKG